MPDSPAPSRHRAVNPRDTSNVRVQKPMGLPLIYEDLTPAERRRDPRDTRIGPPMCGDRTPEGQGHRTPHPEQGPRGSQDQGLRRIQDFVGFGTLWDSRLRGIRDFVGFETLQDLGLCGIQDSVGLGTSWDLELCGKQELYTPRTRILFCGVLKENTNFLDKFKTWTPLDIRLVVSVIHCVLFLWLLGARTLPTELYRAR